MPSDPRDAQRDPNEAQSNPHAAQPHPRDAQHVLPLDDSDKTPANPRKRARRSDPAYKLLFSEPEAAKSLIRSLPDGAELADQLDFARMEQRATEGVDPEDLQRTYSDMVLLIPFAGRPKKYLLLLLEFQTESDPEMLSRFLVYLARALQNIRADTGGAGPGIRIVAALPVVVFSGKKPWTAPTDLFEEPADGGLLEASRPRMPCQVLDVRAMARDSEGVREITMWVALLECNTSEATIWRVIREMREKYRGAEHASLRQALNALVREVSATSGVPEEEIRKMTNLAQAEKFWHTGAREFRRKLLQEGEVVGVKKGEAAGVRRGLEAGRRMALRFAKRTFDADAVAELAAALDEITDPDQFEKIADWIFECDSGEDLLDRVRNGHV